MQLEDITAQSIKDTTYSNADSLFIAKIKLSGNRKTKDYIVMREVSLKVGQTLAPEEITKQLDQTKDNLMNTSLFVDVKVWVSYFANGIATVSIDMKERWYLIPIPYFSMVDRNFNQWWVEEKASFDRINYGVKLFYNNVSGRNDNLNVWVINGYTQQISLRYNAPFTDKALTKGLNVGFQYARQREMAYNTVDNKQAFFKDVDHFILRTIGADVTYSYRPDTKYRYYARLSYTDQTIADTVAKLNPDFFPENITHVRFPQLTLTAQYFNLDYIPYPTKGFSYDISLSKRGITAATNMWQLSARFTFVQPIHNQTTFFHTQLYGAIKLPFDQPYYSQGLFGYGDFFMRGMEYYVVDGVAGVLMRNTLHQKLFSYIFKTPFIHTKTHDKIPFGFYLNVFSDFGYAYSPNKISPLNNQLMRSWGIGLDIISIYDFVFRIQYSFNQLGDQGYYFHTRNDF